MKRLLSVITLLMVFAFALPLQAQEITPTVTPEGSYVLATDIFVRGGPAEDYVAVGALIAGASLQPISRSADGLWVMISYRRGYGWIRHDLAYWAVDVDALPIIDIANLTPSPAASAAAFSTPLIPTETPSGNYISVSGIGIYVRAGPGRGYLRLGALASGQRVQPVGQNEDGSWIMIRYSVNNFQFAWIQRNLVHWVDDLSVLPILSEDNLTPTATFTNTATSTSSFTPTSTFTATSTSTSTATPTATETYTATATATATETATSTSSFTPTSTFTATSTLTETAVPTSTDTQTATFTPSTTSTATETTIPTIAPTPTETVTASPTYTIAAVVLAPTDLPTIEIIGTATNIPPTPTPTETSIATVSANLVENPTATETLSPFVIASNMPSTPTPTETSLSVVVQATAIPTSVPTEVITLAPPATTNNFPIPIEALVGGMVLLVVLGYVALYWRGLAAADRYAKGFVVTQCPICGAGELSVETRPGRLLGIPRTRHIVRCSNCRSVLRETGNQRWRYAVDRIENPQLYDRLNGREISETELITLAQKSERIPPVPRPPVTPPKFLDDDTK